MMLTPPTPLILSAVLNCTDPSPWIAYLTGCGFVPAGTFEGGDLDGRASRLHELRRGRAAIVVCQELTGSSAHGKVRADGDRVGELAIAVGDAGAAFARATGAGRMRPVVHSRWMIAPDGQWSRSATVEGCGGIRHPLYGPEFIGGGGDVIERAVIAVPTAELTAAAAMYSAAFGLRWHPHPGAGSAGVTSGCLYGGSLLITLVASSGPAGVQHLSVGGAGAGNSAEPGDAPPSPAGFFVEVTPRAAAAFPGRLSGAGGRR